MDLKKSGTLIAEARKAKNLTQEELGERCGVTNTAVSKWERGICFPDVALLQNLSEILGLSVYEIINGEKQKKENLKAGNDDIENAIEKTIEVSKNEIKIKTAKHKKVNVIIAVVAVILIVTLSVFMWVAFTPADGYGKTKTIRICSYPTNSVYELPIKCKINPGDFYAFGMASYRNSLDYYKQYNAMEKAVEKLSGNMEKIKGGINSALIKFSTHDNKITDSFLFRCYAKRAYVYPMILDMQETLVFFPVHFLPYETDILNDFFTFGAEILLSSNAGDTIEFIDEFYSFYNESGICEVQKNGTELNIKEKTDIIKGNGIFDSGRKAKTSFTITFISHGLAQYCKID